MLGCKRNRRGARLASVALVSALLGAKASAAPITYGVDQIIGSGSVVGTVTTDGTLGPLAQYHFTAWNLTLQGIGASFVLTQANSVHYGTDVGITATSSNIYFDFNNPNALLVFQDGQSSGSQYWCNAGSSSSACYQGKSDVPQYYTSPSAQIFPATGNQIIATVAAVPEPATWALICLGFVGMGFLACRRQPKRASMAA